jgi:protein-S-isoprenylcysteine O-methyltransferase Ste14
MNPSHPLFTPIQLWQTPIALGWACFGLVVAGFLFCWWARLHLGQLWSGNITLKADHRVVDTGPYRLVRHPIYTGMILAALATALEKGTILGLVGVALITFGFWLKARMEERFLRAELGPEAYDAYAKRTPMLAPFLF